MKVAITSIEDGWGVYVNNRLRLDTSEYPHALAYARTFLSYYHEHSSFKNAFRLPTWPPIGVGDSSDE